ncbi:MAG: FAD-dependent monooxygenase, partial [Pseudomonadota bacterium]
QRHDCHGDAQASHCRSPRPGHIRIARLVIGADGAASRIREFLGIAATQYEYGQVAVICNVTPERPHDNRAFERMTPTGPCALLPHVGTRCGLVWCMPEAEADAVMALDDEAFLAQATSRAGTALGELVRCGQRSRYPLRRVVPERDRRDRVLLLGNAAHAIHPVGAQGFNLGLRDVAVLAELLADEAMVRGEALDPGADHLLRAYVDWRQPDRNATVGWSHDMVRLFASASPVTRLARSVALSAVGLSPGLKRRLASRAMGYRGRVPRLALGESLQRRWEAFS